MVKYNTFIRIYSNFAEVREEYDVPNEFTAIFNVQDFNEILEDTIELEGVNVKACSVEAKESSFEGQKIFIRDSENKTIPRKATLVRAKDMLVKDEESGRFYNCTKNIIEYTSIPMETLIEIKFFVENPGRATLLYCYKAITWYPKYRLDFNTDGTILKASAVIKNDSSRDFLISGAELIGGDVKMLQDRHVDMMKRPFFFSTTSAMSAEEEKTVTNSSSLQNEGTELGGLYNYEINRNFDLKGQSQIIIPFTNPTVDVISYSAVINNNNNNHEEKFHWILELCSNKYLPEGKLAIREDGRLIGYNAFSAISKHEKKKLHIGRDANAFYSRKMKLLMKSESCTVSMVTLTFHNQHNKPWLLKFKEIIKAFSKSVAYEPISEGIIITEEGLKIDRVMEKQSREVFSYKISETIVRS